MWTRDDREWIFTLLFHPIPMRLILIPPHSHFQVVYSYGIPIG